MNSHSKQKKRWSFSFIFIIIALYDRIKLMIRKEEAMYNVFTIAKHICESRDWEISNLALNKILYIAQVLSYGLRDKPLFSATIEAWDYGPVIPTIYREFKMFGAEPIEEWAFPSTEPCDDADCEFVKQVAISLKNMKPSKLVAITHREGTGWFKRYIPRAKGIEITDEDMIQEYKDVWAR